jgi:hypothetical protein
LYSDSEDISDWHVASCRSFYCKYSDINDGI